MAEGLTKKQLRELRKLEKMQTKSMDQKNSAVKWVAMAIVSAIFLAIFVGVILVAKDKNKPKTSDGSVVIAEDGYVRTVNTSDPDEPSTSSAEKAVKAVTLVEYADLQCPACKSQHPIVTEMLSTYPDTLRLVFKHFPLISIHGNAMYSAIAAEAAGKQNKFFEYVDHLYLTQAEWSDLPDPQEKFEEYAKLIGLDIEQFRKDQKDPSLKEMIEKHRSEGINNGVSGTPTFFVDGVRIDTPQSLEAFKKIIDDELAKENLAPDTTDATEETPDESTDNLQIQLQE